jgi:hypothetical protein
MNAREHWSYASRVQCLSKHSAEKYVLGHLLVDSGRGLAHSEQKTAGEIAHMTPRLKPVKDQVIVITGASSGIGLVTARMAAKRGARVMLTARNHRALQQAAEQIATDESTRGMAAYVAADVSDEAALRRVAEEAIARFGRIDTWVNGAGISVYGRLMDVSLEDQRRLF